MNYKEKLITIQLLLLVATFITIYFLCDALIRFNIDRALALVSILCVAGFFGLFIDRLKGNYRKPSNFLIEIKNNTEAIKNGGWVYKGNLITPQTRITQYDLIISAITQTFRVPSRFYIVGEKRSTLIRLLYTACSFMLGWWAIPTGPFYTLPSLIKNIKGGDQMCVGDLINT